MYTSTENIKLAGNFVDSKQNNSSDNITVKKRLVQDRSLPLDITVEDFNHYQNTPSILKDQDESESNFPLTFSQNSAKSSQNSKWLIACISIAMVGLIIGSSLHGAKIFNAGDSAIMIGSMSMPLGIYLLSKLCLKITPQKAGTQGYFAQWHRPLTKAHQASSTKHNDSANLTSTEAALHRLSDELYRHHLKKLGGADYVYSPASLALALGMLYNILNEQGQKSFRDKFELTEETAPMFFNDLMVIIQTDQQSKPNTFECGNFVLHLDKFGTSDEIKNYQQAIPKAQFVKCKSVSNAEQQGNQLIAKTTHGLITDALQELDNDTSAVIVNVLYFKDKFENSLVYSGQQPFYYTDTTNHATSRMVKMMTTNKELHDTKYKYEELKLSSGHCQIVSIPFENGFQRVLVVPHKDQYQNFMNKLDMKQISTVIQQHVQTAKTQKGTVTYPASDIKSDFDLIDVFEEILPGFKSKLQIGQENHIYVVKHVVLTKDRNDGVEAAGVTVVGCQQESCVLDADHEPSFEVNADHPFISVITDSEGHILFYQQICGNDDNTFAPALIEVDPEAPDRNGFKCDD